MTNSRSSQLCGFDRTSFYWPLVLDCGPLGSQHKLYTRVYHAINRPLWRAVAAEVLIPAHLRLQQIVAE